MATAYFERSTLLRRGAVLGAGLLVAVAAGCTTSISGSATKADPFKHEKNATAILEDAGVADDVTLEGTTGSATDTLVINAMSDLIEYWSQHAEEVFGVAEIDPLEGGIWAVDSQDPDAPTPPGCGIQEPAGYTNNAFYCPKGDAIAYDIHYLETIYQQYGDLDVAFVFAHEYGHALQGRFVPVQKSIVDETQADCFTGAWARSVTAGDAKYWLADEELLDGPIGDYVLELGDPAGHDPNAQGAHGSVFDRVSAIQEGYFDGPTSCMSNFNDDRVFVAAEFDEVSGSADGKGNVPADLAIEQSAEVAEAGLSDLLEGDAPQMTVDDPGCAAAKLVQDCVAAGTIDVTDMEQLNALHEEYGDFSVFTLVAMAYTAYVEQTLAEQPQTTRQVCVVATLAADLADDGLLSPGDLDEAVTTIFRLTEDTDLIEVAPGSAWDRIDAFRVGYYQGMSACGF